MSFKSLMLAASERALKTSDNVDLITFALSFPIQAFPALHDGPPLANPVLPQSL